MNLITYVLTAFSVLGMELTTDNFDEKTNGKIVFIKFITPECFECKEMELAWVRLMQAYAKSSTTLIAEVNCHGAGEDLCTNLLIKDHPALKYGDPQNMSDYSGSNDYISLFDFAVESIGPICGPSNLNLCDADQKVKIDKMKDQGLEKLEDKLIEVEDLIHAQETKTDELLRKVYEDHETKYLKLMTEQDKSVANLREQNDYVLLKIVHSYLQTKFADHMEA